MNCDLGVAETLVRYTGDIRQLFYLKGHGVAIVRPQDEAYKEVGCIDFDSETLVGKSGGQALQRGQMIAHTQQICKDGRRRYED